MKFKDLFKRGDNAVSVQTSRELYHTPFGFDGYIPLKGYNSALYDHLRATIPIVDAAIEKIIRLVGNFELTCEDPHAQERLKHFAQTVKVGSVSCGLHSFIAIYLDSLLTYGNAVGEIVLNHSKTGIAALYNAPLDAIQVKAGKNPLEVDFFVQEIGIPRAVPYPELILFSALSPKAGEICGNSIMNSLPFVSGILMKIFNSMGQNFERIANLRYAVTYRPNASGLDRANAKDIAKSIAKEWSDAMNSGKSGTIKDFIAVGDLDIKVIGADNQMIDTNIPVRQILEQIVAKLGIPPFMLGLHWSSTERMSSQQADILTSELESYRLLLTPVIYKICKLFLQLNGYSCNMEIVWDNVNLQDEVELAQADFIKAQTSQLIASMEQTTDLNTNEHLKGGE